jgi:hypothetical protein
MTMRAHSRPNASPFTAGLILRLLNWLLKLATRVLARSLNMPEPLVHTTGVFVFAQVQASRQVSAGRSALSGCGAAFRRRSGLLFDHIVDDRKPAHGHLTNPAFAGTSAPLRRMRGRWP